jgi:hypothetical protein
MHTTNTSLAGGQRPTRTLGCAVAASALLTATPAAACGPSVRAWAGATPYPSLTLAIRDGDPADPVVVCAGVHQGPFARRPSGDLTLLGATGRPRDVLLTGTRGGFLLEVTGGTLAVLDGLTFADTPTTVEGLLWASAMHSVELRNVDLARNKSGWGVAVGAGDLTLENLRVEHNTFGHRALSATSTGTSLHVRNLTVRDNPENASVAFTALGPITIDGLTYANNDVSDGHAVRINGGDLDLRGLRVSGNTTDASASSPLVDVMLSGVATNLSDISVSDNDTGATVLQLIYSGTTPLAIEGLHLEENVVRGALTHLFAPATDRVTLSQVVLRGNQTGGSLIFAGHRVMKDPAPGVFTIEDATITDNQVGYYLLDMTGAVVGRNPRVRLDPWDVRWDRVRFGAGRTLNDAPLMPLCAFVPSGYRSYVYEGLNGVYCP